jgi:two-component system nitrate/nitrite response regulator NarL
MIRIFLVDDHSIFRAGLRRLLELEADLNVVGEACDLQEITRLVNKARPDILLIDLKTASQDGLGALKRLSVGKLKVRAIVLMAEGNNEKITDALKHGARGVVIKNSATKVLVAAIRSVAEGNFWIGSEAIKCRGSRSIKPGDLPRAKAHARSFGLTPREMEMICAIVSGYSNREIARKYSISEDTVKHHVTNVFDKVGVCNRLELALFAIHHGLARMSTEP